MTIPTIVTAGGILLNILLPAKTKPIKTQDGIYLPKPTAQQYTNLQSDIQPLQQLPVPQPVQPTAQPQNAVTQPQNASDWHYDCRPQREAVYQAVVSLGLSSEWTYIDFIFSHESCHDPGRLNSEGCGGLGQACPVSKLPCESNDITCQVQWFSQYAQRYGGWYGSYQKWLASSWW